MKITYRGGYNITDPDFEKYFIFADHLSYVRQSLTDKKHIAVVTYAKPDGYFDKDIKKYFSDKVEIIRNDTENVSWDKYDIIYLLGGNQAWLISGLIKTNFDINNLKKGVHIIGDSAGAMILSTYFYHVEDDKRVVFHKGLLPDSNLITIVHANNPHYAPKKLFKDVKDFAKTHNLEILTLKENEEITKES